MKKSAYNQKKKSEQKHEDYGSDSSHILTLRNGSSVMLETVEVDAKQIFADVKGLDYGYLPTKDGKNPEKYIKYGSDDQLPYHVIRAIEKDEVLSQNKMFNTQVCFGQGLRFYDKSTGKPTINQDVIDFCDNSNIQEFFAGIIQDMKWFYWSLSVILLDRNDNIVGLRRMPVENVRLGVADAMGNLNVAYFGNFRADAGPMQPEDYTKIELLNEFAPWKDLSIRLGKEHSPVDGEKKRRTKLQMFGVLCRMPMPGCRYYPIPTYAAVFKDDWLEIKKLTQLRLKAAIKNTNSIRYHVEILQKYWIDLFRRKGVYGNREKEEQERQNEYKRIGDFLSDMESAGKTYVSEYMTDPDGRENRNVRINVIDTKKQGGEWSDEVTEACNMLCYADGIHPNLIGAVPGKTQVNNSGSDKRELFTMKQAMEAIWHSVMMRHFMVYLRYMGLNKTIGIDVPIVQLTTLDNHIDAIKAVKNGTDGK